MPNVLQIGTSVDLSTLRAGFEEAKASTRSTATAMAGSFEQLAAEAERSSTRISGAWQRVASASLVQNKASAEVRAATRAAKEAEDDDAAALARLALAKREAAEASAQLAAAQEAVATATKHVVPEMAAASASARLLEGNLSVRAAERFLSTTLQLGPALAAAFPIVGAIIFVDLLVKGIEKFGELIDAAGGFGEAIKKAYEDTIKYNDKLVEAQLKHQQKLREAQTVGLTGPAKTGVELANVGADTKDAAKQLFEYNDQLKQAQKTVEELDKWWVKSIGLVDPILDAQRDQLNKAKAEVERLTPIVQRLNEQVRIEPSERRAHIGAEAHAESLAQARETAAAEVDAERKAQESLYAARVAAAQRNRALGISTIDEETKALLDAETERLAAERTFYEQKRVLARREQAETGKPAAPALTTLSAEEDRAAAESSRKRAEIEARAAEEHKRLNEEAALARIEDEKRTGDAVAAGVKRSSDAQLAADEQGIKERYALHQIEAQDETTQLLATQGARAELDRAEAAARYEADRKAINDRIALLKQEPEKNAAAILTAQSELRALEIANVADQQARERDNQAKLAQIRAEGARKAQEDARREMQERIGFAEATANRELQTTLKIDNERLRSGRITRGAWLQEEIAAIEQWYQKQAQVLQQALAQARLLYGEQSTEYQKLQDKLAELDQQRASREKELRDQQLAEWRNYATQVSSELGRGLNQWIQGQKTFGQAMADIWNGMVMDTITALEKQAEKFIANKILMTVLSKVFHLEQATEDTAAETARTTQHLAGNAAIAASDSALAAQQIALASTVTAVQATGTAEKVTENNTTNVAIATSDAAVAAAAAFASVMEALPFPANVAAAPPTAAAVLGEGLSFASLAAFEAGGLVPNTGMALVHGGEMVLPKPISEGVQAMVRDGGASGSASPVHMHLNYAPVISGGGDDIRAELRRHKDEIGNIMRQQVRQFNRGL